MSDDKIQEPIKFKILKGTIIKLHNYPAQLTRSLEITCKDGNFLVENIRIIGDESYFNTPKEA